MCFYAYFFAKKYSGVRPLCLKETKTVLWIRNCKPKQINNNC